MVYGHDDRLQELDNKYRRDMHGLTSFIHKGNIHIINIHANPVVGEGSGDIILPNRERSTFYRRNGIFTIEEEFAPFHDQIKQVLNTHIQYIKDRNLLLMRKQNGF